MRTIRTKAPLHRRWAGHHAARGLVAEADVSFSKRSRLRVKLLVFSTRRALRTFWRHALESPVPYAVGATHNLTYTWERWKAGKMVELCQTVDPRYVCIVGFVRTRLTMEIVCHEAMHAGFAVAGRVKAGLFQAGGSPRMVREEAVCYPAGAIAASINRFLHARGLYAPEQVDEPVRRARRASASPSSRRRDG